MWCGSGHPPGGWAALTLEGSASPRHDVLDKGWERRRKTATSHGPSRPLKPLLLYTTRLQTFPPPFLQTMIPFPVWG